MMKNLFVGAAALFLLLGCESTPNNQIAAFGHSTGQIVSQVDVLLDEFNNATLERGFTSLAANYKGQFAEKFNQQLLAQLAKPLDANAQQQLAIYRLNRSLGEYALALSALADARASVDIDAASANLFGALKSFNAQYKTIKRTDDNLFESNKLITIQSAIAAIGSEVVEAKRRAALKRIIVAARPNIDTICDAIINQLSHAGIEDGISMSREFILNQKIAEYRLLSAKKSSKLKWRIAEVKRLWQLQQALFHSKLLVQQSIKAIKEVKSAHQILADEVSQEIYASAAISHAIGRMQYINKHFNDFEQFLLNCQHTATNSNGVLSCED